MLKGFSKTARESCACEKNILEKIKNRNLRKMCQCIKNGERRKMSGKQMKKHREPLKKQRSQ